MVETVHLYKHASKEKGQLATAQGTSHYWCVSRIKTKLAQRMALNTSKNEGEFHMANPHGQNTVLSWNFPKLVVLALQD